VVLVNPSCRWGNDAEDGGRGNPAARQEPHTLRLEQGAFHGEGAWRGITEMASQRTVRPDHAMAGDGGGERVAGQHGAHGAG
jgi:hypothetical protein